MQEGAGVRQIVEDALRRQGVRLRDLDVRLELGLQESVRQSRRGRVRRDVHLAYRGRVRPRGRPARRGARRRSRRDARDLARVGDRTRAHAGRGRVRRIRARAAGLVIVRWGLDELAPLLEELGLERAAPRDERALRRARASGGRSLHAACGGTRRSRSSRRRPRLRRRQTASSRVGGGSAIDTAKAVSAATGLPAGRGADDVLRLGVDAVLRHARRGTPREDGRLGREHRRHRLRAGAHARPPARRVGRHGDERARALRGGALRRAVRGRVDRSRADRALASARRRGRTRSRGANEAARGRDARRHGARRARPLPRSRDGAGARRPVRRVARRAERALPRAGAAVQRAGRSRRGRELSHGDGRRRTRRRGSRSSPGSAASSDFATSESRRTSSATAAVETAERPAARSNPRPATPADIEALFRSIW